MLSQLLESRPVRRRSPAGFAASLALHGIVVGGAMLFTSHAARHQDTSPTQTIITFDVPRHQPPPPARSTPRPLGPLPIGPSVINVPITVPDGIPPIDPLRAVINTDQPFEFRIGVPSHAASPPDVPSDPGMALLENQVEVPAALDGRSPLPRYPQMLRDAGVEGMVRLRFVVDTAGHVEAASVQVIDATHPAFIDAVRAILPRLRFTPARVDHRAVRQLVEIPLQFRLNR